MTMTCGLLAFPSSLFSKNGRVETVKVVIVSDNRRITLRRSHAEVTLFSGIGSKYTMTIHVHVLCFAGYINFMQILQIKMSVQLCLILLMDKLNCC